MMIDRWIPRIPTTQLLLLTIITFQLIILISLFLMQVQSSSNKPMDNTPASPSYPSKHESTENIPNENPSNDEEKYDKNDNNIEDFLSNSKDQQQNQPPLQMESNENENENEENNQSTGNKIHDRLMKMDSFEDIVREISANYQTVIISVSDYGYKNFALNFVERSLKPHGLDDQYVIVAADPQVYEYLRQHDIVTVLPKDRSQTKGNVNGAEFGTRHFTKVVNMKGGLTVDVLKYGASIFLSDVDIAFFENPLPILRKELDSNRADVVVQTDSADPNNPGFAINSGFYLADPTIGALKLFEKQHSFELKGTRNQPALIKAKKMMANQVKIHILDWQRFPNGAHYFDQRQFEKNKNLHPVIVHNNWLVGMHAKRYRFREIGAWAEDPSLNNRYYNNPEAKYITTTFPPLNEDLPKSSRSNEKEALKNLFAVAQITNRIPILPFFHCFGTRPGIQCLYYEHFLVKGLDLSPFSYREHYFLKDERVPKDRLDAQNLVFSVNEIVDVNHKPSNTRLVYKFEETQNTISRSEIEDWIGSQYNDVPLIDFVGLEKGVKIAPEDSNLWRTLDKFIVDSDSKQEKARKFKI